MEQILESPVPGYPGIFITSDGRVLKRAQGARKLERKQHPTKLGYMKVSIFGWKMTGRVFVHRLLAKAFIPNPENKPEVDHIDGNRSNNALSNLRWATHRENIQWGYDRRGVEGRANLGVHVRKPVIARHVRTGVETEYESVRWWTLNVGNKNRTRAGNICRAIRTGRPAYRHFWRFAKAEHQAEIQPTQSQLVEIGPRDGMTLTAESNFVAAFDFTAFDVRRLEDAKGAGLPWTDAEIKAKFGRKRAEKRNLSGDLAKKADFFNNWDGGTARRKKPLDPLRESDRVASDVRDLAP